MNSVYAPNVYKLRYGEGFEWLLPVDTGAFEQLRFNGTPQKDSWKPVQMRRLKVSDAGRPLAACDFPACSGGDMFIINRAAKEKIGSHLEQFGELLPLACDEGDFWTLNVTCLVNALDENNSQLLRATDTGAILMIRKHVFLPAELGKAEVFKIPQVPRSLIYVTSAFVDLVNSSGLTGIEFVQVWAPMR